MSSSEASVISPSGLVRWAPFGVPVVPEVRITKRGLSIGGAWSAGSPAAISCSTVVAPVGGAPSCQATIRCTEGSTPARSSANSSSKTSAFGPSRFITSTSCGPENIVFR